MEINLKFTTSKLFEKIKNLIKPYDDYDSPDVQSGKSYNFSCLYVYGILLKSYFRNKKNLDINDRRIWNMLQFISFVPVIAGVIYKPKNIIPILLGATTDCAVDLF